MDFTLPVYDFDLTGGGTDNLAVDLGNRHLAGVDGHLALDACTADGRLRAQQRHGLALHVRPHQRTVHIIMLQERDERRSHTHSLARRHVHIVHAIRAFHDKVALIAGQNTLLGKFAILR